MYLCIAVLVQVNCIWLQNMYLSFGDIGANIKKLVDEFQDRQKSHAKIESIADMKVRGKLLRCYKVS